MSREKWVEGGISPISPHHISPAFEVLLIEFLPPKQVDR